jgi:UDP-2,3-diacylglucosamine diphosphatase
MAILFISDLHIDAGRPDITGQFAEFLRTEARAAEALYILGDLFESWVGDDAPDSGQAEALAALRSLTAEGVPCFVMHGNRDFLLGQAFCAKSGAQLLPDPLIVTLYGERILVMHGDALCTDDRAYQRLRATVRDADWQRRFLGLSAAQRRALAGAARTGSQARIDRLYHRRREHRKRRGRDESRRRHDPAARAYSSARHSCLQRGRPPLHAHRAWRLVHPRKRAQLGLERAGAQVAPTGAPE